MSTTLFSFLLVTRGIGNILSTPISTALQRHSSVASTLEHKHVSSGFGVAEGHFHAMIVYTGICFAAAAVVALVGWGFEKRARAREHSSGPEGTM